jgi:hypothetical protein
VGSNYRIGLVTCPSCKKTVRTGGAEDVVVEPHVLETALCHAEVVSVEDDHARASQTIPPRIQRAVRLRHHDRCAVPGCRNSVVDLHHLDERAEGGTHDPDRLIPLCGAHHDAAHRKVLRVGGDAQTGFRFAHADGRPYGSTLVVPHQAQSLANIEKALCLLGYKAREARAMVDAIRGRFPPETSEEELMRAALCEGPVIRGGSRVSDAFAVYGSQHRLH